MPKRTSRMTRGRTTRTKSVVRTKRASKARRPARRVGAPTKRARRPVARGRSGKRPAAATPRARSGLHTTSRTGAQRAAKLKRTLAERPDDMPVEFPNLGVIDRSKEARDQRADERRRREDHQGSYAVQED